jgi:small subunit ribosomal protein S16
MAVRIRCQRFGRKKRPFYRIVAANSESPRDGKFLEILGYYDPLQEPSIVKIKTDRLQYWLNVGAKPSNTVAKLIENTKLMEQTEEGGAE